MLGEKISVQILGRVHEIDAEGLTPIEANFLAQFVQERMQEIQKQTGVVDSSRLAVLTALNLADELWRLKRKSENTAQDLERKFNALLRTLNECLGSADGSFSKPANRV